MDTNKESTILDVLKLVAPGTPIRNGLENILKAKTGGLIVIGDSKEVLDLVDGGFSLNIDYTSSRLYELAKMDGAIILSSDFKKIYMQMHNLFHHQVFQQQKLEQDIELQKERQNKLVKL